MSYLETKYVNLVSGSLRNFKRKGNNLFNFSCPFCGDSQKDERKARGYVYNAKGTHLYTCHNCGLTTSVGNLIKLISPVLYMQYIKELMLDKYKPSPNKYDEFAKKIKKTYSTESFDKLKKVSDLPKNHPCLLYVESRLIPKEQYSRLFYISNFMFWTNQLIPNKFAVESLKYDEGRLVIPFYNKENKMFGYQGRKLGGDGPRYITIMLDEDQPHIFGLDRVDLDRRTYVFEGPIDSLFIPNSVAAFGGHLHHTIQHLNKETAVLCFDNEPRNKETIKKIYTSINLGYRVCIWPKDIHYKDINEMILNDMDASHIKRIIDEHSHKDMEAMIDFTFWTKIKEDNAALL